ncbi:MAG TPA: glycosyltransferase, partial [bacterium]|nr:glycosyltransferase [bacterium]
VWAVRAKREGESFSTQFLARLYYFIIRNGVGLKQVPPTGADFFLLDRMVLNTLSKTKVRNSSLLLLISSFPFAQSFIIYTKEQRTHGKSGWSLKKKLKLFFDSITMFSKAPIYWILGIGLACLVVGIVSFSINNKIRSFFYLGVILALLGLSMIGVGASILRRLHKTLHDESADYVVEKSTN